jgi:hypothetical protein
MSWASLYKANLKENRPQMYRELVESGEMEKVAKEQDRKAGELYGTMIEKGSRVDEAREVALKEYILLPSEEDQPRLGESQEEEDNWGQQTQEPEPTNILPFRLKRSNPRSRKGPSDRRRTRNPKERIPTVTITDIVEPIKKVEEETFRVRDTDQEIQLKKRLEALAPWCMPGDRWALLEKIAFGNDIERCGYDYVVDRALEMTDKQLKAILFDVSGHRV